MVEDIVNYSPNVMFRGTPCVRKDGLKTVPIQF